MLASTLVLLATLIVPRPAIAGALPSDEVVRWNRVATDTAAALGLDGHAEARVFSQVHRAIEDALHRAKFRASADAAVIWNRIAREVIATRGLDAWGAARLLATANAAMVEGSGVAEQMARFFGTDLVSFTVSSGYPSPGIARSFRGFSQAARECAEASGGRPMPREQ
jgi:hypothetical protein